MNIQAETLSIGNFILHKDIVQKVINIGGEGVLLLEEMPPNPCKCTTAAEADICNISCNNGDSIKTKWAEAPECEHIPFTPEWATKFNIEKTVVNGYGIIKSRFKTTDYELYYSGDEEAGPIVLCQILSVAHAQNLFKNLAFHTLKITK